MTEYREIAPALVRLGVLTDAEGNLLRQLAGYRSRMVHFYHEISERELYDIAVRRLGDVETVLAEILRWIREHPERIDRDL